jgi:catechol 2,3-dioxygenase-like lactoylglutathione lyase family enzyme
MISRTLTSKIAAHGRIEGMFDHFGFVVRDLSESLRFYVPCLAPLGLRVAERQGNEAVIICGESEFPFIWMDTPRPQFWRQEHGAAQSPFHLALSAPSIEAVGAFHEAGMRNGGVDNGVPGARGSGYYAAYLLDPDGNNVEAGVREAI